VLQCLCHEQVVERRFELVHCRAVTVWLDFNQPLAVTPEPAAMRAGVEAGDEPVAAERVEQVFFVRVAMVNFFASLCCRPAGQIGWPRTRFSQA
jgi:hypothetical protein